MKAPSKQNILLMVLGALIAYQVYVIWKRQTPSNSPQEEVVRIQERIDRLEEENAEKDRRIQALQQSVDSLDVTLEQNNQQELIIRHRYEKIPHHVTDLSNNQLRRAFADY